MAKENKIGWMESHKYLALFVFAGILFLAAQAINFIFFASFREAVTRVIGL
jgi:hypothetical protein